MSSSASQRALGHVAAIRMSMVEGEDASMRKEALARQALGLLPPQDRSVRCYVATRLGLELRKLGRINAASEAFAETVACANQGENPTTSVLAICQLADLHLIEGLVQKVLSLSEEALFLAQNHFVEKDYPLLPAGLAHIYAGISTYERDDLEVAQSHFENAITFCELWGQSAYTAAAQAFLAETYFARGNLNAAKKIAVQSQETLLQPGTSWVELEAHQSEMTQRQARYYTVQPAYTRARLAALSIDLQDIDSASEWLEELGYQSSDPFDFSQAQVYLSAAKVLMAQRNIFEARRLIRYLVTTCESVGANYYLVKSLVLQAQLLQHASDYQSALVSLRRAVQISEGENYIRTLIDGNPDVGVLLQRLGTIGPGSTYARSILTAIERQDQRGTSADVPVALSTRPLTRPMSMIDDTAGVTLTDREKEIIRLIESYLTEVEIAYRLSISTRTVDTLVRNLCRKFGVRESREIPARARQLKAL
jgi:ATP/maltotriose-dependent transcriptional regulator MalT